MKFFRLTFLLLMVQSAIIAQPGWRPAYSPLSTVYSIGYSPASVPSEYPRPQMVRENWMNLNGLWDLVVHHSETNTSYYHGKILVPFPVESALSGVGMSIEPFHVLNYKKGFTLPEGWKENRILLHFGAVDWETEVQVNSKVVGTHKGGYDSFSFDITDFLTESGEQTLTLRVKDPTDWKWQPTGKQKLKASGIWYTPVSGIWQTVWLEPVPKNYIKSFRTQPKEIPGQVYVQVETSIGRSMDHKLSVKVKKDGYSVAESSGRVMTPHLLSIPEPHLWTPADPYLYELEISIEDQNGVVVDKVDSYLGLRTIALGKDERGHTRIMLNGKPLFQLGVLDQGYWPEGLYTAPSEAAMKNDIQVLKDMGFNMIRKHVKVEPARWYALCDKMGMLVWQDMPNGANANDESKEQFMLEMKAMVDNLSNHPSIVVWVPFNEGWGQHSTEHLTEQIKVWDPTRLVNSASGWTDFGVGDINDIHAYPGPAAPAPDEKRAIVLGEFGGLGLNVPGHSWSSGGWGYELKNSPEELLMKYEDLFGSLLALADSTGLSAAVYTQLTDIETENNGLMTYDRKIMKMDSYLMSQAHSGHIPPKPLSSARIFAGKTKVALTSAKPGAGIFYTMKEIGPDAKWKKYKKPFKLKKSQSFYAKARWADGKASRSQNYAYQEVEANKSQTGVSANPGISLKVFEGAWDSLPDLDKLSAVQETTAHTIGLSEISKESDFGLLYTGWIKVPNKGTYTFFCKSDDGSRLSIANQMIVNNDGIHGMKEASGSVALKKGFHQFRLEYFQKKGGKGLELWMEGADGKKMPVPVGWYYH